MFKNNLYDAVQHILNYDVLKEKLLIMNKKKIKKQEINSDIFREYESQLRYLEKSVNMLKRNLDKDSEIHKQDNMRIMKTNVDLIKEINKLRLKVKEENKTDKPETAMKRPDRANGAEDLENEIINLKKKRAQQEESIAELLKHVHHLEKLYHLEPT